MTLSRKKAFWVSFALTLGLLVPLYAAALFFGTAGISRTDTAVAGEGVGIAVRRPDAGDAKNLLLAVRGEETTAFLLMRFDALQGKCCVGALPRDLALTRENGEQTTLAELDDYAGPGVAAQRLAALLDIRVDHYLSLSDQTLVGLAGQIGNVSIDTDWPELDGLTAPFEEGERVVLSAPGAAELLQSAGENAAALRARIYSSFLLIGMDRLNTLIPDFLRAEQGNLSTDILATDIYDYQRILDYLALLQPEMLWGELECTAQGQLTEEAQQLVEQLFR